MTVKARKGRVRHVAFRLEPGDAGFSTPSPSGSPSRKEIRDWVLHGLSLLDSSPQGTGDGAGRENMPLVDVTRYDGTWGLLRTSHRDLARVRQALERLAASPSRWRIVSLGTSGTMHAATRRWGPPGFRRAARPGAPEARGARGRRPATVPTAPARPRASAGGGKSDLPEGRLPSL